jgi:hypothetical protein
MPGRRNGCEKQPGTPFRQAEITQFQVQDSAYLRWKISGIPGVGAVGAISVKEILRRAGDVV